jgi:hypothetical protein
MPAPRLACIESLLGVLMQTCPCPDIRIILKLNFLLMLFMLLTISPRLLSITDETGSLQGFIYGSEPACGYDNWISHLAEGIAAEGYNFYAPWDRQTNGFGGFRIPDATELGNWGSIMDSYLQQDWLAADSLITLYGFPYELVRFQDTDTGRTYFLLREEIDDSVDDNGTVETYDDETGAFAWGWGLYIYNPNGNSRVIITVPHPCDDFITPVLGHKALVQLDAGFMLINGAGREVVWTNAPPYTNSKSLSDPTRTTNHPWNPAYNKICNKIRSETGRREFSLQLHSYDSSLHRNYASNQISAGYNKQCPNLPIRDLSRFKLDLLNQSSYLVIPANTIGNNNPVYLNDYYTVQYNIHPFTFTDGTETVNINNTMDLPAYSQNSQMLYTLSGWNDYDVFEPFFHIEMDEHPNCFDQTTNSYNLFYGWDTDTSRWNMDNLFTKALQYYSIWINDLSEVLDDALQMNDNSIPLSPYNLQVTGITNRQVTLGWEKGDDYDFDTYEVLYTNQPWENNNYSIYSRANSANLASPHWQQATISNLNQPQNYSFRIRAKDKNGNYSSASGNAPVIANLTVQQRTDGSKIIDIFYDLYYTQADSCHVTVILSDDNGLTYSITPNPDNISGDVNAMIPVGDGKQITWNAGIENYTLEGSQYRIRVLADDGL